VLVSDVVLFTKATLPNTTPAAPVEVTTSPAAVAESVETIEEQA